VLGVVCRTAGINGTLSGKCPVDCPKGVPRLHFWDNHRGDGLYCLVISI